MCIRDSSHDKVRVNSTGKEIVDWGRNRDNTLRGQQIKNKERTQSTSSEPHNELKFSECIHRMIEKLYETWFAKPGPIVPLWSINLLQVSAQIFIESLERADDAEGVWIFCDDDIFVAPSVAHT
eukprot:TRINITY_DN3018_c0_g1_i1.p1 TRINITY_DN3018_c0_g1~~TRINITY_DN3018_c0_g1_i1.p1  ORF type:complete len:143 (-),score=25.05 TRINITY_DN3018_c0_g1_i1:115-486(-)